jgi:hypothetical protein
VGPSARANLPNCSLNNSAVWCICAATALTPSRQRHVSLLGPCPRQRVRFQIGTPHLDPPNGLFTNFSTTAPNVLFKSKSRTTPLHVDKRTPRHPATFYFGFRCCICEICGTELFAVKLCVRDFKDLLERWRRQPQ